MKSVWKRTCQLAHICTAMHPAITEPMIEVNVSRTVVFPRSLPAGHKVLLYFSDGHGEMKANWLGVLLRKKVWALIGWWFFLLVWFFKWKSHLNDAARVCIKEEATLGNWEQDWEGTVQLSVEAAVSPWLGWAILWKLILKFSVKLHSNLLQCLHCRLT